MCSTSLIVALEGVEGSGKTVLSRKLAKYLQSEGYEATCFKEPSSYLGNKIKQNDGDELSSKVNALLFAADRLKQYSESIKPSLENNDVVLLDRSVFSSLAYQSCFGMDREWIETINKHIPFPDLFVFVDIDPEVGLERISDRNEDTNFDKMVNKAEFQREVRENYLDLVRDYQDRCIHFECNGENPKELSRKIGDDILKRLKNHS